jgi:hypothetical protein
MESKASGAAEGVSAKAKEIKEIRSRLEVIVNDASYALQAISAVTEFSVPDSSVSYPHHGDKGEAEKQNKSDDEKLRAVTRAACSKVVSVLLPLLRCKLVETEAYQCLLRYCGCIEKELLSVARDLADAVRVAVTVGDRPLKKKETRQHVFKELVQVAGPIQRLIHRVQTHVARAQVLAHAHTHAQSAAAQRVAQSPMILLPSTVHLLHPVIRTVLSMPSMLPGCELTFMVLDA